MALDNEDQDELLRLSEQAAKSIGKVREKANALLDIVHPANHPPCHASADPCDGLMLVLWQSHYLAEADRLLAVMQLLLSRAKVH